MNTQEDATYTHPHTRSFGKIQRPFSLITRETRAHSEKIQRPFSLITSRLSRHGYFGLGLGFPLAGPFCQVDSEPATHQCTIHWMPIIITQLWMNLKLSQLVSIWQGTGTQQKAVLPSIHPSFNGALVAAGSLSQSALDI